VLTPSQKGSIAESAIVAAAIKLRVPVCKPINEGLRYDLVFELGDEFVRVQCKWAVRRGDALTVSCLSRRRCAEGFFSRPYTADEIDAFAAYCPQVDRCYFLPLATFPDHRVIQLRLAPTRNNQRRGIHWAEEYEFGATLGPSGAVAQLGERERGTLEAAGSSPAGSTLKAADDQRLFSCPRSAA
jgi:hypothetical protein